MDLTIDGLRFAHEGQLLLEDVSLTVPAGRLVMLLGPSGSGKTTLLRCIAGLAHPEQGKVGLGGRDLGDEPPERRRIGMMFQEPALFPHLDAAQNVAFGMMFQGVAKSDRAARAHEWLAKVGLAARARAKVDALSGGERQRLALARTLAARPDAVLLDEPLSALDADLRRRLGAEVKELLRDAGVPALWVTHDEEEAHRLGDQVLRLHDRRVVPA